MKDLDPLVAGIAAAAIVAVVTVIALAYGAPKAAGGGYFVALGIASIGMLGRY